MAYVFKRRNKKGICWYAAYKDETGRRRCVKGFTDKAETLRIVDAGQKTQRRAGSGRRMKSGAPR